jgi:hypothetical protein
MKGLGKEAREICRIARRVLASQKVGFKYQDIGHGAGSVIWWVDNHGKVQTYVSTGKEFHHELNRRMDMDARWRGRIDRGTKVVTMIPPLRLYQRELEDIPLPDAVMNALEKMGGQAFLVDTMSGLRRVAKMRRVARSG